MFLAIPLNYLYLLCVFALFFIKLDLAFGDTNLCYFIFILNCDEFNPEYNIWLGIKCTMEKQLEANVVDTHLNCSIAYATETTHRSILWCSFLFENHKKHFSLAWLSTIHRGECNGGRGHCTRPIAKLERRWRIARSLRYRDRCLISILCQTCEEVSSYWNRWQTLGLGGILTRSGWFYKHALKQQPKGLVAIFRTDVLLCISSTHHTRIYVRWTVKPMYSGEIILRINLFEGVLAWCLLF